MGNAIEISNPIAFEDAITVTQSLLDQREQGKVPNAEFETLVLNLMATHTGARGFFVAYLTDARPLVDTLTSAVTPALQQSVIAAELLVKNLAMSTAMEMTHSRNQNPDLAQQSAQVQRRTAVLMAQLGYSYFKTEAQNLWQGVTASEGPYVAFLKRWGYDAQQQQAIATRLLALFPEVAATHE